MELYASGDNYLLYHGSMLDMGDVIDDCSIDAIVTDPPYELNFMNKGWDNAGISFQFQTWRKCFNVLKPGGYLLAFGGSRTFHRIAVAIEDAGFEIRDTIMWLYGSGFPKAMDLGKSIESKILTGSGNPQEFRNLDGTKIESGNLGFDKMRFEHGTRPKQYLEDNHLIITDVNYKTELGKAYDNWKTALKPAFEPIIVARKPCEGTCVDNVMKYGVGALNIGDCKVGNDKIEYYPTDLKNAHGNKLGNGAYTPKDTSKDIISYNGRYPSNVILTYDDDDFEEVCGGFPESGDDSAARYFYCAKASKRDRDEGCEYLEDSIVAISNQAQAELKRGNVDFDDNKGKYNKIYRGKNTHPTVKPTDLMQYLVRLVAPKGSVILDPFNGSGSTGKAVMYENKDRQKDYCYIGIDLSENYLAISKARIEFASGKGVSATRETPKKNDSCDEQLHML